MISRVEIQCYENFISAYPNQNNHVNSIFMIFMKCADNIKRKKIGIMHRKSVFYVQVKENCSHSQTKAKGLSAKTICDYQKIKEKFNNQGPFLGIARITLGSA